MGFTRREELAALEGWACNRAVPLEERLQAAMQVIKGLREFLDGNRMACPYDCDNCHDDECPCDRSGCAGVPRP